MNKLEKAIECFKNIYNFNYRDLTYEKNIDNELQIYTLKEITNIFDENRCDYIN